MRSEIIKDEIEEIRSNKDMLVYGCNRMADELKDRGLFVGRNRTNRIMRFYNIHVVYKRKYKATTDSKHGHLISENILNRNFTASVPNEKWVSDITYIHTTEGWLYLCTVIDLYSRKVVGWSIEDNMKTDMVVKALIMAIKNRKPSKNLIFHSDRGVQYASVKFRNVLKSYNFKQSMSRKGNCWDNAVAESFFHTLKAERVNDRKYKTRKEAKISIFEYIELFYNRTRKHSYLKNLSPRLFEIKNCA